MRAGDPSLSLRHVVPAIAGTVLIAFAVMMMLAGCSSEAAGEPIIEAGADAPVITVADAGVDAAPPLPPFVYAPPQLRRGPGIVMKAPKVTPVFATGDADEPAIVAFLATAAVQSYLASGTAEYGVGTIALQATTHFATAPPATLDDVAIQAMLTGDPTTYPGGDDVMYLLYYPATVALTVRSEKLCTNFGGYHDAVTRSDGTHVIYAVLPRCGAFSFFNGFDFLTYATTHEIAEALTNPLGWTPKSPALAVLDADHAASAYARGGQFSVENADLCIAQYGADGETAHAGGFVVTRLWSNTAAMAGHDPCVGGPAHVYATLEPVIATRIDLSLFGLEELGLPIAASVPAVTVKAGGRAEVRVHAYSDAPSKPWKVFAREYTHPADPPEFPVTLDKKTAANGDELTLTISPSTSARPGNYVVVLASELLPTPQLAGLIVTVE